MAQLSRVVLLLFATHSTYSNPWTSLRQDSSQEYRKTDVPESGGEGWTSLLGSNRKGRLLSHDDKNDGWTSLLNKYDRRDSDIEKAPKIIAISDTKPEEETISDGPEEKQFGNFGLPSFLPSQAGYYNPNQIYKVPSDNEIANDVFNLPHGLADIGNFQNSRPLSQPTKNPNNLGSPFPQSVLGLKLPTIFNSNLPIHPATNPLTGATIQNNRYPNLPSHGHNPYPNNPNRFPPRRPNFPTPEFLPFPPIGPPNRPNKDVHKQSTTTIPTTTTKHTQGNDFKKPPNVPNTRPVRHKKKKKHTTTTTSSAIYDEVFDQEQDSYDDEFNQDEEKGHYAGLEPFEDIDLPESKPTKNPSKFSSKPLQQLQDNIPFPGEVTPSDVTGRLDSLDEILGNLHITTPGCQRRLICHLAKDPEKFTPLSHLVLDHLELQGLEGGEAALSRDDDSEHMARYLDLLQAMEAGKHRLCYKYSDVCKYKGEDMINSTGLRAWKLMYRVLTMKALALRDGKQF